MTATRLLPLIACLIMIGCVRTDDKQNAPRAEVTAGAPQNAALGRNFDLKATTHFVGFSALNQATVSATSDQLVIVSSGGDPQVAIPAINISRPSQFAVRIEMTAPADTVVQLYYTTTTIPVFAAENVASATIKAGRSTVLFEINDPTFTGTLRFDPGQSTGEYIVHNFELFSSEPLTLSEKSTSTTPPP